MRGIASVMIHHNTSHHLSYHTCLKVVDMLLEIDNQLAEGSEANVALEAISAGMPAVCISRFDLIDCVSCQNNSFTKDTLTTEHGYAANVRLFLPLISLTPVCSSERAQRSPCPPYL